MNRWTPLIASCVALVLLAGGVGAHATLEAQLSASETALSARASHGEPPREAPSFRLVLEPREQRTTPGGEAVFRLALHAREPVEVRLQAASEAPGLSLRLADDALKAGPDEPARTALVVHAGREAPARAVIHVTATAADGTQQQARGLLDVRTRHDEPRVPEEPREPGFKIHVEPPEQKAMPGERVAFAIHAHARNATTLELSARAPAGYEVVVEPPVVELGGPRVAVREPVARLVVAVPAEGAQPHATVVLEAVARETGERQALRVVVRTPARDAPSVDPDPPGWRMALMPEHAEIGAGGGRVALLLENGGTPRHLTLAASPADEAGWKIELERHHVRLGPHERTFVYVALLPGEDAGRLAYVVHASDGQSRQAVKGTAEPRMA